MMRRSDTDGDCPVKVQHWQSFTDLEGHCGRWGFSQASRVADTRRSAHQIGQSRHTHRRNPRWRTQVAGLALDTVRLETASNTLRGSGRYEPSREETTGVEHPAGTRVSWPQDCPVRRCGSPVTGAARLRLPPANWRHQILADKRQADGVGVRSSTPDQVSWLAIALGCAPGRSGFNPRARHGLPARLGARLAWGCMWGIRFLIADICRGFGFTLIFPGL